MDLPQVQAAEVLPTENDHIILSIKSDGALFLDEYPTTMADLDSLLRSTVLALNKQLFLRAAKAVPYGVVMEVMGCIRAVGITNLGMVAESGGGPVSGDAEKVQSDIKPATGMTSQ